MQERQTKQKQIIYETLTRLDHPTATEVYTSVREAQPSVSRATVFRVLGGFAAVGKAKELRLAGSEVRYDYNVTPHYHARCWGCNRVVDVCLPEPLALDEVRLPEFSIEGYGVEFFGRCKACQSIS